MLLSKTLLTNFTGKLRLISEMWKHETEQYQPIRSQIIDFLKILQRGQLHKLCYNKDNCPVRVKSQQQ